MSIIRFLATSVITVILVSSATAQEQTEPSPFATFDKASKPVLADPHDIEIGPDGRLYVADKFANRITIMDAETLEVVGSFGEGQLIAPHDVSFAPDGRILVADTSRSRVASQRGTLSTKPLKVLGKSCSWYRSSRSNFCRGLS